MNNVICVFSQRRVFELCVIKNTHHHIQLINKVAHLERLFSEAKKAFGKIDIVAANAGIELVETPVVDFTEEQFDRVFSINTKGTYFTMQQAARHVEDNGRIIFVASSTSRRRG